MGGGLLARLRAAVWGDLDTLDTRNVLIDARKA
jgi:hypothetical protein